MARQPRLDLPNIAQHVVQRGNNRLPCFLDDDDRRTYLSILDDALEATGCNLHAYVLMNNHVHLLATPSEVGALSKLMQQLGRRYVGWFNHRHQRTGTLWEGRYKACLVDSETYFLRCQRYIDLNPVRAGMSADPVGYRWSSCAHYCARRSEHRVTAHPCFTALGKNVHERARIYQALLDDAISDNELSAIRSYLQQQRAFGTDRFQAMVETKSLRFAGIRAAHRPSATRKGHRQK